VALHGISRVENQTSPIADIFIFSERKAISLRVCWFDRLFQKPVEQAFGHFGTMHCGDK
jgi:hypothetical protein